ncbi:15-hydroxyprostaglandin dehydrogenase [NAD] [Penicillium rolfsii]|nr:15-hydroxyprostaglandin dehydrogenase [NAD] [Penicillium rolfsii]
MSQPVAIITGASSGMGLAVTKHLVAQGWRVAMADIDEVTGRNISAELGDQVLFCVTDVTSYSQQAELFRKTFSWGGNRLDLFAANAGIADTQFLHENVYRCDENGLPLPLNLKALDVNLTAVIQGIWLFKHYARQNKVPRGKVVVTSSSAGLYPMESNPIYTASKHALVGLTRALGPSLHWQNIQINAICPGFVPTSLCPKEMLDRFPKEHITPMSTVIKAYDTILGDHNLHGQTVELSLDQLYFRTKPDYPNESQRWLGEDSASFWEEAYTTPVS